MNRDALFRSLKAQWQQSPLLRWGGLGIVLILAYYSVLVLDDARAEAEAEVGRLQQQTLRLEQLLQEKNWPERAEAARSLRVQLETRLWQASTPGLAQAELQSWLERSLRKAGLADYRVSVEVLDAEAAPRHWTLGATLQGPLDPPALYRLLQAIESHQKLTVVEQLDIEPRAGGYVTLRVRAYVLPVGESE